MARLGFSLRLSRARAIARFINARLIGLSVCYCYFTRVRVSSAVLLVSRPYLVRYHLIVVDAISDSPLAKTPPTLVLDRKLSLT